MHSARKTAPLLNVSLAPATLAALGLGLLSLAAAPARAQATLDNTASINSTIGSFGTPDSGSTPTYGQTFTDPAGGPVFQTGTFFVQNNDGAAAPFEAYLYAWNGTAITGPALYSSGPLSIAPTGAAYSPVTVSGVNTTLAPGGQYIFFFSTLGFTGPVGGLRFETAPDSSYAGGTFEYNNAQTFANLSAGGTPWNPNGTFGDLGFRFTFGPNTPPSVPEPSQTAALGLGALGLLGLMARARRRKAVAA